VAKIKSRQKGLSGVIWFLTEWPNGYGYHVRLMHDNVEVRYMAHGWVFAEDADDFCHELIDHGFQVLVTTDSRKVDLNERHWIPWQNHLQTE
jgi:hypothetical protein